MFPLMNISFIFQNFSPSALVWYTSRSVTFIKLSHSTRWPLNVTPFLSSTSWGSALALAQICQHGRRIALRARRDVEWSYHARVTPGTQSKSDVPSACLVRRSAGKGATASQRIGHQPSSPTYHLALIYELSALLNSVGNAVELVDVKGNQEVHNVNPVTRRGRNQLYHLPRAIPGWS